MPSIAAVTPSLPAELAVRRRGLATVLATAAVFVPALDTSYGSTSLPYIAGAFAAPVAELRWLGIVRVAASLCLLGLAVPLAARFGARRVMVTSLLATAMATLLCAWAPTVTLLATCRGLASACAAPVLPMALALLVGSRAAAGHGGAVALWGVPAVLGGLAGPLLAGLSLDGLGWQGGFIALAACYALLLPLAVAALPGGRGPAGVWFDWVGTAALGIGLVALPVLPWAIGFQNWTLAFWAGRLLLVGLLLFGVLARWGRLVAGLRAVLADRGAVVAGLLVLVVSAAAVAIAGLRPLWIGLATGSTLAAGAAGFAGAAGTLAGLGLAAALCRRMDARWLAGAGLLLAMPLLVLMTHPSADPPLGLVATAAALQGVGAGLVLVALPVCALARLPPPAYVACACMLRAAALTGVALGTVVMTRVVASGFEAARATIEQQVAESFAAGMQMRQTFDQQATLIAYSGALQIALWTVVACLLGVLLLRHRRPGLPLRQ